MTSGPELLGSGLRGPIELPVAQLDLLQKSYLAPPRAYHHFGHVQEVLRHYRAVDEGPGWHRPIEVWLAVLYHDAVYIPGHRDNELESAKLAVEHIARWQPAADIDAKRVSDLILLTARHGELCIGDVGVGDAGEDARQFLDCDMAILGATAAAFVEYDRAIAEEYRTVPRWLFRIKRRQFFKKLLAAERIFLSDFFRERFEAQARKNLQAALSN